MRRKQNKKSIKIKPKEIVIISLCIVCPMTIGFIEKDLLIGWPLLSTSLLGVYLASIRKRSNYIFGAINSLLLAYVSYKNNLYGSFFVNIFVFFPIEIIGFFLWSHNLDSRKNVKIRKFTTATSIMVTTTCTAGSILLGYILTKIPNQQLAFMDSTICCLDICSSIFMNLRFREAWWLGITSGILSVIEWSIILSGGGDNTLMRLLSSIGYLSIYIYGAIKWGTNLKNKPSIKI